MFPAYENNKCGISLVEGGNDNHLIYYILL